MKNGTYSFRYIKQSGVLQEHVFESISCPDQFQFSASEGAIDRRENRAFSHHADVQTDYSYSLDATLHHNPPRIYFHEIISASSILVRFNEPVRFAESGHSHVDLKDKETGQFIPIESAELLNGSMDLFLHTGKLPAIRERFYSLSLSGIRNLSGEKLSQNQIPVTVVYRPQHFFQSSQQKSHAEHS
jgi:hypothetical protein